MSIYTYLTQEHNEVKDLMNQIEDFESGNENAEKRDALFNELKKKLILHSKAEEKAFYQPLKKFQETKEEVEHGKEEHQEAEQLLKELTEGSLNGAAWHQKFRKLKEAVEHHIEEEESEIFKDAQKVVDESTADRMEDAMKELKEEERNNRKIKKRKAA